jgi:hypothetical protein
VRDLIKSAVSFSWAMSLFAADRLRHMFLADKPDKEDRTDSGQTRPIQRGRFTATRMVVIGEGLAAGMGEFTLNAESQRYSFPAQMARQMEIAFAQPLLEAPGLSSPPGFATLPVIVPAALQTSVLKQLPPVPLSNLSIPGFTLTDALTRRPLPPLVHRNNAKQTLINLAWGALPLARGEKGPLPAQVEYAAQQQPALTLIELGYQEALEAAVSCEPALLPDSNDYRTDYEQLLSKLKSGNADLIVLTIPDPLDTAHFSNLNQAAELLKVSPGFLRNTFGLDPQALITVRGLNEMGFQLFAQTIEPLPDGCVLDPERGSEISNRVAALNNEINSAAEKHSAHVYDLHAFFKRIRQSGINLGPRTLSAEYLGGFYSLNGFYPGATGHAQIANELLQLINRTYDAGFSTIDINNVMRTDPVAAYRQAAGPLWLDEQISNALRSPANEPLKDSHDSVRSGSATRLFERQLSNNDVPHAILRLPAGLEQVLPLSNVASYFGDGIAALNTQEEQGMRWGSSGNLLFGGLAMVDSHLSGFIKLRFSHPSGNLSHFEVSFLSGLTGDDAVLVAPQYFKMAFQKARVDDVPGCISSGTLNLETGDVTDLRVYARYSSTALMALVSVNPTFPKQPLTFPGQYGSAWAHFDQRDDGNLDFTFYGSTFVPLGPGILWPLNFAGPSQSFATVPASGTVMHPHLHLSTKEPIAPAPTDDPPEIPVNTIQELTLHTHNSSFGDAFTLNTAELGGPAKGRSHILGRVQVQFGPRCGDSVPVAISHLDSGGILNQMQPSPITTVFPGRLYHGPRGFNEFLRFPLRTYSLDDLAILDDPFDISMGMVDLRTGRILNNLLHRGFINQDLIFALLRVEARTPKDSFYFRGPARFEKGVGGRLGFRFQGTVRVPYPAGFLFPKPNLTMGFPIGPDSVLDPFLWIRAVQDDTAANIVKEGGNTNTLSSSGEMFSYRYRIPSNPTQESALFEYENLTQDGSFRLHSLSWIGFGNSLDSVSTPNEYDVISFSGFGIWTKDGRHSLQQVAVQISTVATAPYVGIQIGSGDVSDVNTKPENEQEALP